MVPVIYGLLSLLLLSAAIIVFRVLVRRDYHRLGHLSAVSSGLQLALWLSYVCFPYIYNPPDWWLIGFARSPVYPVLRWVGTALVIGGMLLAVAAMGWLGFSKSFGQERQALRQTGFYRWSRNPQLLGGAVAVAGVASIWPSWYAVGWAMLYGVMAHLMVMTEEEHLRAAFGEEYEAYCLRVPRYLALSPNENRR